MWPHVGIWYINRESTLAISGVHISEQNERESIMSVFKTVNWCNSK